MKIILTPARDSHNSDPSENSSGVEFTSARDDGGDGAALTLTMLLPDGRALTFDARNVGRTLVALGVFSG